MSIEGHEESKSEKSDKKVNETLNEIEQSWVRELARKERLWNHNLQAMEHDGARWEHEKQYWLNLSIDRNCNKLSQKIWTVANLIVAFCAITGAVCSLIRARRK